MLLVVPLAEVEHYGAAFEDALVPAFVLIDDGGDAAVGFEECQTKMCLRRLRFLFFLFPAGV